MEKKTINYLIIKSKDLLKSYKKFLLKDLLALQNENEIEIKSIKLTIDLKQLQAILEEVKDILAIHNPKLREEIIKLDNNCSLIIYEYINGKLNDITDLYFLNKRATHLLESYTEMLKIDFKKSISNKKRHISHLKNILKLHQTTLSEFKIEFMKFIPNLYTELINLDDKCRLTLYKYIYNK